MVDYNPVLCGLAKIDENLIRGELTAAERSRLSAERKKVYEAIHPETKAGVAGGKASGRSRSNKSQVETRSEPAAAFIDDTAKKTGRSRASVARDVARYDALKDKLPKTVRTSLDKGADLGF